MNESLNDEISKTESAAAAGCGCGPDCCGEETLVETGRLVNARSLLEGAAVSRTVMPVAVREASSGCCGPARVESGGCC